jgi:3-ketosteroid 9alpha-monooxygenase subunit B
VSLDPQSAGVSAEDWAAATAGCFELRVRRVIEETADARSFVLEVPPGLAERFRYRAGQFLSFKIPLQGKVLTRSYSLASSPDCDAEHKVTVKRIEAGRVSNWMNDRVRAGDRLFVTPPAGFFVLGDAERDIVLFSGGSGITPVISIVKSALATTRRRLRLVYANRDERSIIFREELAALAKRHPDRFEIVHSLDVRDGLLDASGVTRLAADRRGADFYLCGPGAFMATVESALLEQGVPMERIHIERFASPPDPGVVAPDAPDAAEAQGETVPEKITIVLDGVAHEVPYQAGERVLHAARRAGLDPPFSCEEGYCSCCMAKLVEGEVKMHANDCLSKELLAEGWVLTCQSRCVSRKIRIEYPD